MGLGADDADRPALIHLADAPHGRVPRHAATDDQVSVSLHGSTSIFPTTRAVSTLFRM
jgi:hypothetical protein